jgi:hypothetical protein
MKKQLTKLKMAKITDNSTLTKNQQNNGETNSDYLDEYTDIPTTEDIAPQHTQMNDVQTGDAQTGDDIEADAGSPSSKWPLEVVEDQAPRNQPCHYFTYL